ncbi:MAG: ATP-binding protein [Planctomycetota bacterium]
MSGPIVREIRIPNDTKFLADVRAFLQTFLQDIPRPFKEPMSVVLAVDEAVTNVIEHGYDNGHDGDIRVECRGDAEQIEVLVEDWGRTFDPNAIPDPDIQEHVRQGRRKGLGIYLMRQIMDEINYEFRPGEPNRLRLVKKVPAAKH